MDTLQTLHTLQAQASRTPAAVQTTAAATLPTRHYVGIDIAKLKFDAALILPAKADNANSANNAVKPRFKSRVFANNAAGFTEFLLWLQTQGVYEPRQPQTLQHLHVCMEATGTYYEALAEFLNSAGLYVSIANPAQVAHYTKSLMQRGKTDVQDAKSLALYAQNQQPSRWQPQPLAQRQLLALVRQHQHLGNSLQAERVRLQTAAPVVQPSVTAVISALELAITALELQMGQHIEANPELKANQGLLASVPGIGDKLSVWLLAYLGDGQRFGRGKQAVAYAGLNPAPWESGSSVRGTSHISKVGQTDLRKALYMPAVSVYGHKKQYRAFVERLQAAGKTPKVIIVALMRKILAIAQAVLRSQQPFNAALHAT